MRELLRVEPRELMLGHYVCLLVGSYSSLWKVYGILDLIYGVYACIRFDRLGNRLKSVHGCK